MYRSLKSPNYTRLVKDYYDLICSETQSEHYLAHHPFFPLPFITFPSAAVFQSFFITAYIALSIRWGNTPLDDARQFGRDGVVSVLTEYQQMYLCSNGSQSKTEDQRKLDTVKVVV